MGKTGARDHAMTLRLNRQNVMVPDMDSRSLPALLAPNADGAPMTGLVFPDRDCSCSNATGRYDRWGGAIRLVSSTKEIKREFESGR
jgi:hypothetical protein